MNNPLPMLFLLACVVLALTALVPLLLRVMWWAARRQHAAVREYMANMPALPVEPEPETDEARRVREACNEAIRQRLDAGDMAVLAEIRERNR